MAGSPKNFLSRAPALSNLQPALRTPRSWAPARSVSEVLPSKAFQLLWSRSIDEAGINECLVPSFNFRVSRPYPLSWRSSSTRTRATYRQEHWQRDTGHSMPFLLTMDSLSSQETRLVRLWTQALLPSG